MPVTATDPFADFSLAPDMPAERSTPIVKSDNDELVEVPRAIYVGTAGDVVGRLKDDTVDRTFKLGVGYHPLRFRWIKSAGTTAADMIALF